MFVLGIKKSLNTHIVLCVARVIHYPNVALELCFPYSVSYSGCQGTQVLQTSLFLSTIYISQKGVRNFVLSENQLGINATEIIEAAMFINRLWMHYLKSLNSSF